LIRNWLKVNLDGRAVLNGLNGLNGLVGLIDNIDDDIEDRFGKLEFLRCRQWRFGPGRRLRRLLAQRQRRDHRF
jgi:hypothetical protein